MKRNFVKMLMTTFVTIGAFLTVTPAVHAQNLICDLLPFLKSFSGLGLQAICGTGDGNQAVTAGASLIRFGLQLIFVGIIIVAIYIIIKAAVKYIQSEGDETKIGEAQKAIKSVFVGIASLFVGIIGIVIVLAFFNASGAVDTSGVTQDPTGGQIGVIENFFDTLLGR